MFLENYNVFTHISYYYGRRDLLNANREFGLNKYTKTEICGLPTAEELRAKLNESSSDARVKLALLFDEGTFVETGVYTQRALSDFISTEKANELEGVITGYGAVDGKLVFAFAEDSSRMDGAIDERHAKKITDIYKMAISNGAPVVGIFDSNGTDVFEGTVGLSAYGKIIAAVSEASGVIPQIALVSGKCIGTAAAIAAMFDFTVKVDSASLYIYGAKGDDSLVAFTADATQCVGYVKSLISNLPSNSSVGIQVGECVDNLNRALGDVDFVDDALVAISSIADNSIYIEVFGGYAPSVSTVFATVAGVKCGVVASSFSKNEGRIDADAAKKVAKFVNFCNSFSIPVITLVDSLGLATDNASADLSTSLAKLAFSYATSNVPKVTVVLGHAIGASFVLLGSKSLGADVVYSIDNAEIGALNAESGVAFAWDKYITEENTREKLVADWKATVSSPVYAAASGEIDDIISINELRARICSALLMLSAKGNSASVARRKVLPL